VAGALDDLAQGVISPVQAQGVDHQILRADIEVQHRRIRNHPRAGQGRPPPRRFRRHHGDVRKRSVNLGESLLHFDDDLFVQEQGTVGQARGAGAVADQGGAVGQGRGHGAGMGVGAWHCKDRQRRRRCIWSTRRNA
jgi:hypothetical protein